MLLVRLILIGPEAGHFCIFCISVRCFRRIPLVKLFDYRIKLCQPCTVAARANVSSSDRSELLLSLRFSYIWVAANGCFLSVASYHIRASCSTEGFAVALFGRTLHM